MIAIPVHSRTVQLEVKAPNIDDLLTDVVIGQLIQLRIIYDNAANSKMTGWLAR